MSRDTGPDWSDRAPRANGRPRVIVIGGGVSGMATGVYGQMNGMDTRIFETHVLPGGCCTAWSRKGYIFDYCIEWLIGTGAGNDANRIWRELGALDGKSVRDFDMFNKVVDEHGRSVTFYNDPDRLERHLLEISPADEALIRSFCADLRRFIKIELYPFLKPDPLKSAGEKIKTMLEILPAFRLFWRNAATPMHDFADKFRDPLLKRAFRNIFYQDPECFPLLPYLYNMACAYNNNAGFPQGGSLGLSRSIEERYTALGGILTYRARVDRILVEDGRAVGVELKGGARHYADFVVSAADGYTTIYGMLEGKYKNKTIDTLYDEMLNKPGILFPAVVSAFVGLEGDLDPNDSHSTTYMLSEEEAKQLPGALQASIVVQLRSRYSDGFAPAGRSVIHCTYFSDFNYWRKLRSEDRKRYWAEKKQVGEFVRGFLEKLYPGIGERIELVDVASPATTKRYTGNSNGSILAWKAFSDAEDLANKLVNKGRMQLPGLGGFYMAGQWVGLGGLIRAASSGRFVMQFICKELGREFKAWESGGAAPWHTGKLGHFPQLDKTPSERPAKLRLVDAPVALEQATAV
ncbi:NAD(P)/FAD-dependent oxidoreductase [Lysobacter capsici]|uniref:phytoene desaturase family protein n=1 Tax=Lysobacter capsici TaxID=435897 RepID=UPI00177E764B|nr:NAD(P)/FAD-dependent oxidoreductase [Lysobacter capsici]UOF16762.1 NAD(P)/FAD-dependent oxidoreductase [Lysobacter capsici]